MIKKLAGQTAIYGLSSIVGRLLNYFLVPLYTRIFLPSEYGVVTEMYAYVSFLMIIFTYGMETAFFRFSESESDKEKVYSTALWSLVLSSILIAGMLVAVSPSLATSLRYPGHGDYISWFALILGIDAVSSVPFARLRAQNKSVKFALLKLFNILTNVFLNLFFLVYCPYILRHPDSALHELVHKIYSPDIGVGYIFISNLAASGITLLALIPELSGLKSGIDLRLWKKLMIYSLPLLIAGLAGMVNETMDRILLKFLLPDKETALSQLGIYGACYKLSILMTLFIQMFRYAAEPFFFSHSSKENSKEIYAEVLNYFVITCSFIFLGIMMYIDLVKYFIGEKYYSGLSVVPVLLFANICLGIFFNLSIWYKLTGQTKYGAYLAMFGAIITLILNYWWIPLFGYTGSAWATLVCYFSMMVLSYIIGNKFFPVPYETGKLSGYLALALLFYFISYFLKTSERPALSTVLEINTLLFISYGILVYLFEKRKKSVP